MSLPVADFDHNDFESGKQNEADKKLLVKFGTMPMADPVATAEKGHRCFKEVEVIYINIPGQRDGVVHKVTDKDKQRFPEHYKMYKDRTEAPETGTPLFEWPIITRSMAEMFSFKNVKTVEQLADLNDNFMHEFPGAVGLKRKAQDYLESVGDDEVLAKMRDDLESKDTTIGTLQEQVKNLIGRMTELEESKTSKKK